VNLGTGQHSSIVNLVCFFFFPIQQNHYALICIHFLLHNVILLPLCHNLKGSCFRCRHGYFHVVNNDYTHWEMYAIGGSAEPTINSQGNRYLAPTNPFAKEVL
jgi:hypothetical protein